MTLPAKRAKPSSGIARAPQREWPRHRKFVRSHGCCVPGCGFQTIECAHVRQGGDAGTSLKPPDWKTISLCSIHHAQQHTIGHAAFDRMYGINSLKLAAEFAAASPDLAMRETMKQHEAPTEAKSTAGTQNPFSESP
jgi:hypothetical protein